MCKVVCESALIQTVRLSSSQEGRDVCISWSLTFEFFPPLRADCREYVLWTTCSGVEGDLSEEWSEPFSTMFSPSWLCGVGERERLRRTGEQAGVLLFELLAVLK